MVVVGSNQTKDNDIVIDVDNVENSTLKVGLTVNDKPFGVELLMTEGHKKD